MLDFLTFLVEALDFLDLDFLDLDFLDLDFLDLDFFDLDFLDFDLRAPPCIVFSTTFSWFKAFSMWLEAEFRALDTLVLAEAGRLTLFTAFKAAFVLLTAALRGAFILFICDNLRIRRKFSQRDRKATCVPCNRLAGSFQSSQRIDQILLLHTVHTKTLLPTEGLKLL